MIPRIYGAIHAVAAALSKDGIVKERLNARDDYLYRSIDDVLKRLAPLLAEHRLCILPRVLERTAIERPAEGGKLLMSVAVRVAFDLVSVDDGSIHVIEGCGEALDGGDKATAKAMQSAYKYAILQVFCVPVGQVEDADARSHRLASAVAEPTGGWSAWIEAFRESIERAEAPDDLAGLQEQSRSLLQALARESPDLYRRAGEIIAAQREVLAREPVTESRTHKRPRKGKSRTALVTNGSGAHV